MDPEKRPFAKVFESDVLEHNGHTHKKGDYGISGNGNDSVTKPVEESPFVKDQKRKRLILALSAHSVVIILGLRYTAPVWLPDVKDRLSLTQAQMSTVGWCLYAGSLVVGIPINRSLQRLVGKTVAFWIAACCAPLGYLYLHLAMVHQIKNVFALYVISLVIGYTTGSYNITIFEILTERLGNDYVPVLSGSINLSYSIGGVTGCLAYMHNHDAETFLLSLSIILFIAWIPIGITQYLRDRVIPKDTSGEKGIDKEATPDQHQKAENCPSSGSIEDMPLVDSHDDKSQISDETCQRGKEGLHLSVLEAYKKIIRIPSYYIVMMAMFLMYGIMTSIATNLGSLAKTIGADTRQVSHIQTSNLGLTELDFIGILACAG